MPSLLFALGGLLVGILVNTLADELPGQRRPGRPRCPHCGYAYPLVEWLALGRFFRGRRACANCAEPLRQRHLLVELFSAALFATLPLYFDGLTPQLIYGFHLAVLLLIIVIDLEHRLILHVVTVPATLAALLGSFLVADNSPLLALGGAAAGFVAFLALFWLGQFLFGPGALGFGDVTLAMTMGAMLGLHRILFALVLGILLGGLSGAFLLISRRSTLRTAVAYGPFLAVAAMIMILWGLRFLAWYAA